jgi:hypothetical protein
MFYHAKVFNHFEMRQMLHDAKAEMEYGSGREEMADDVVVGDNIAMLCQSSTSDENFWIMLVDTTIHMVKKHFIDVWGQKWFQGDYVIWGLWYEKSRVSSKSYYLLENSLPAFVYSHLIMASKFPMPPTMHFVKGLLSTYELSTEVLEIIREGVVSQQLMDPTQNSV